MKVTVLFVAAFAIAGGSVGHAQDVGDLGRILTADSGIKEAVEKIVAAGPGDVPLLLSWAESPPPVIGAEQLNVALADAFGRLRTKEAIPFLIKNISLNRAAVGDMWLRSPEGIEESFPAVAALERIGPEALDPLIRAYSGPMVWADRLALIFTVSRMKNPRARSFLQSVRGEVNLESYFINEGLKLLDESR